MLDFDGRVTFEDKLPGEIRLHEQEIRERKPDDVVKASFKQRFDAKPKKVLPVFLPVWNLHLKTAGRSGTRIVSVDGLAGKQLDW